MAARRKHAITKEYIESERYYIEGNAVRKLDREAEVYVPRPRRQVREQEVPARREQEISAPTEQIIAAPREQEIRHEKREAAYDLRYTVFLATCVAVMLMTCFVFMQTRASMSTAKKQVSTLQTTLASIEEKNSLLKESLNTTIDLDEIYRVATEDFGMVYAGADQVIYYNSSNSDYVRQYSEIPD